jgi:hypothetical protein
MYLPDRRSQLEVTLRKRAVKDGLRRPRKGDDREEHLDKYMQIGPASGLSLSGFSR